MTKNYDLTVDLTARLRYRISGDFKAKPTRKAVLQMLRDQTHDFVFDDGTLKILSVEKLHDVEAQDDDN